MSYAYSISQTAVTNLTNPFVAFVYTDSESYTWISTLKGINRYDGYEIKQYRPDSKDTRALQEGIIQSDFFEDTNTDMWFTTIKFLHRYNRITDDFDHFQMNIDSAFSYRFVAFFSDSTIGLQIGDQLYAFNILTESWTHLYSGILGIEYQIVKDGQGHITHIYCARWDYGKGVLRLNFKNQFPVSIDTLFVDITAVALKKVDDVIWVVHHAGFIEMLPSGFAVSHDYPDVYPILDADKNENSGEILVTSLGNVYEFSTENYSFELLVDSESQYCKGSHYVSRSNYLTWDINDGIILSSYERDKQWKIIYSDEGGVDFVFSIERCRDCILFGFYSGSIIEFDGKITKVLDTRYQVCPIYGNGDEQLFMDDSSFYRLASNRKVLNKIGEHKVSCDGAVKVQSGYFVFGLDGIAYLNNQGDIVRYEYVADQYTDPYVKDQRIFAYGNSGVSEFTLDGDNLDLKHLYPMDAVVTQYWLKNDSILYISTNEGIKVFNTNSKEELDHIEPSLYVQSFHQDHNKNLWLGTRNGLYKRNAKGQLTHYNEKSGLPGEVFSQNCVTSTVDGTLYWGTNKGVLYFHPDSIKEEAYNPPMYLTSLQIHGHEWANDTINVEMIPEVDLKYNENTLTFEITAVNYDQYSHPQFRVFLKGHDVDTVDLGEQRKITYPNLAPGQYTFLYSACKLSGTCRSKFNSFDVTINPPYWKTWWFRLAMILLGLGIILGAIRLYIRNRLREQKFVFEKQELTLKNELQLQQERNRIADELHDELGGKLSSIKFAGKKVQKANSLEEVKSINKRVSEISTELIDSMRSIIWAMDTHNDNLFSLLANIRQYASTLADDNDLKLSLKFPDSEFNPVVKGQIRHHLYLAIKEVLNNVLKHSEANQISIQVNCSAKLLEFIIHENGQGFDPANIKSSGRGLKNLNKRMDVLNGTMTMTNEGGMTTHFSVPL